MKRLNKTDIEFLRESNAIEGVYDIDSLYQAKEAWKFLKGVKSLTIGDILKTHKILMLNQNLMPDEKGYFRKCKIYVGGREGVDFISIPERMGVWIDEMNLDLNECPESFKEEACRVEHICYELIHPFVDGNGRTGRMFMNWHRIRSGLPIVVIHEGKEQMDYYKWFKD